jgi:hypothetical protein
VSVANLLCQGRAPPLGVREKRLEHPRVSSSMYLAKRAREPAIIETGQSSKIEMVVSGQEADHQCARPPGFARLQRTAKPQRKPVC